MAVPPEPASQQEKDTPPQKELAIPLPPYTRANRQENNESMEFVAPVEHGNVRCREPLVALPDIRKRETARDLRSAPTPCYSTRSAFIGEIDAARFAGIIAATNEQKVNAPVATVSAGGSHHRTPYNWAESNFPAPIASGNPRISPISTRAKAPARTSCITFLRSAPSAMRIPISLVFCATA